VYPKHATTLVRGRKKNFLVGASRRKSAQIGASRRKSAIFSASQNFHKLNTQYNALMKSNKDFLGEKWISLFYGSYESP
jgi:hypothetical protein